jgi:alpha-amylase/alpha-mannosidase (GH57 family)
MDRYVCIHAHFYQPPRENPWLEAVELQDSAYPYHDWNERITAECYAPNSAARILGSEGRINKITNNYSRISFNFGPTLLSWMEQNAHRTYELILEADIISRESFSGHGSAMAQAYNHMILPLANRRDKYTQILWGIRDFQRRFGRDPEGMWLPETAVDIETLEVLAELGIKFTVLAPHQAKQFRELRNAAPQPGGNGADSGKAPEWRTVEGANIDPTRAYVCPLPSGRSINLFFYDGPISRAVAFERLLANGETFASRLLSGFSDHRDWPQLLHIATDGETYGHHHAHGDMALSYALDHIESNHLAKITNYGEYLELHPPEHEVEIVENTAWSCAHGVGRWATDCGCNSGGHAGWNQQWRAPLRSALDWLRDDLASPTEQAGGALLKDPWTARNDFIEVVLDRSPENVDRFLDVHATHKLNHEEQVRALKLLEMQRHAMLMYTSCGWFFDELTGIETVQVIQYAGRAVQLAQTLFGDHREQEFVNRLKAAQSNVPGFGSGAEAYEHFVKPAMVDLLGVGAHYAITSLFDGFGEKNAIYCYDVDMLDSHVQQAGRAGVAVGRARIMSRITREQMPISFGVLHFGDHNLSAGVRRFRGDDEYHAMANAVSDAFGRADLPEALRVLDRHFEGTAYSLKSLFRDEQRRIVTRILENTLAEAEASYRQIYEHHASLMRFLAGLHAVAPKVLLLTAEFVINGSMRRVLEAEELDLEEARSLLETATREKINLDVTGLEYLLRRRLNRMADELAENPGNLPLLARIHAIISTPWPFEINLWRVQNVFYGLLESEYPQRRQDPDWAAQFTPIVEKLNIRIPAPQAQQPVAA